MRGCEDARTREWIWGEPEVREGFENMQQTAKNIRTRAGASENSDENTQPEESETGGDDTRGNSRLTTSGQWMMPAPAIHLLTVSKPDPGVIDN